MIMSDNNWETQPRKKNGEFTFKHGHGIAQYAIEKTLAKLNNDDIRKISRGGSYGYLRKFTAGNKKYEIHHMPAASASPLFRWKGPCIIMLKEDHKQTSSYKRTKAAIKYRHWQAKLISEGKFLDAEYMDIKNIRRKFGDKYDKSILEKLEYENKLEKAGEIYGKN